MWWTVLEYVGYALVALFLLVCFGTLMFAPVDRTNGDG